MDRENWLQAETDKEWLARISMEAEMEARAKKPEPTKKKKKRENKEEKKEELKNKKIPTNKPIPEFLSGKKDNSSGHDEHTSPWEAIGYRRYR